MSTQESRTLFIVFGIVGGLFLMGMIAAMAVFVGAGFFFYESSAVAPPPARAMAPVDVKLEAEPAAQPDDGPVIAPVP